MRSGHTGSSPQVRGTSSSRLMLRSTGDIVGAHPRRCGEHQPVSGGGRWVGGSSPQVRGTSSYFTSSVWVGASGSSPQVRGTCGGRRFGLIPAGAGMHRIRQSHNPLPPGSSPQVRGTSSTPVLRAGDAASRAHPRRCGEHDRTSTTSFASRTPGLIPAGAGNIRSPICPVRPASSGAHPRRCGEHSDPQVGKLDADRDGLIPAGAGNILNPSIRPTDPHPGAHPRRCGEHDRGPRRKLVPRSGAHPRRCGEHLSPTLAFRCRSHGLIPAGAGNICSDPSSRPLQAHPRRCGEHDAARRLLGRAHPRRCGEHPRACPSRMVRTMTRAHPRRCGEHTL